MGDYRVSVLLDMVRNLEVPVILMSSFIDSFVKGVLHSVWRIVPYNSKPVPISAINDLPKYHKDENDKGQYVMMMKEDYAWCPSRD